MNQKHVLLNPQKGSRIAIFSFDLKCSDPYAMEEELLHNFNHWFYANHPEI